MKKFMTVLFGSIAGLLMVWGSLAPVWAEDPSGDNYATLNLPVAEFGFRGVQEDGKGTLYVSSLLKNGVFLMPFGCRTQACSTFIRLFPPLSAPGRVVAYPSGGAFILLRFGDRIVFVPTSCLELSCTKTILLPSRPSYPSSGVIDPVTANLWVTDQLSDQIAVLPKNCFDAACMSFITLPSQDSQPSGIAYDPDNGFWVTERIGNRIALIPQSCRKTSCVREFPIPSRDDSLNPFSPVTMGKGQVAFLTRKGKELFVGRYQGGTLAFNIVPIDPDLGKATRISKGTDNSLVMATQGEYIHVGRLRVSTNCLTSEDRMTPMCTSFTSIPIPRGEPFALSQGKNGVFWITLRNRDDVLKVRLSKPCLGSGKTLPSQCYTTVSFARAETLYHREYHQEVSK